MDYEFPDRYGGNAPDPSTACRGDCEGTGVVPIHESEPDPLYALLWLDVHSRAHSVWSRLKALWHFRSLQAFLLAGVCDGWHFVECPECQGTGTRRTP